MSASTGFPRLDPQLRRVTGPEGGERIELSGPWILRALEGRLAEVAAQLTDYARDDSRHWALSSVTRLDHAGAMLLWRAWGGRRAPQVFRHWLGPFSATGVRVIAFADHSLQFVNLVGRLVIDTAALLRRPRDVPWLEISASIYRTGAQALAITALVGFLVGIVLSYLSSQQIKTFGADIFIINLLGVSIIRELVMLRLGMVGFEGDHASKMPADLSGEMNESLADWVGQQVRMSGAK